MRSRLSAFRAASKPAGSERSARPRSLRARLAGLVIAATLPGVGMSVVIAGQALHAERQAHRRELEAAAAALAASLDRDVTALVDALVRLGASLTVAQRAPRADEAGLAPGAVALAALTLDAPVTLRCADRPEPWPGWDRERPTIEMVEPAGSGGPRQQPPTLAVPVLRGGLAVCVLRLALTPDRLAGVLAGVPLPAQASATVLDGAGIVLAGNPGRPDAPSANGVEIEGEASATPATAVTAVARPARLPDWQVMVADCADRLIGWSAVLWRLTTVSLTLLIGVCIARRLAGTLARPLAHLTRHAQLVAAGAELPAPTATPTGIVEFEALRHSLAQAEAVLRRRAAAERMAMREARTGHELLASVVNGTADMIHVKDTTLRYVLVNAAALRSTAQPMEEWQILGRRAADIYPPEIAEPVECIDAEVLRTQEIRKHDLTVRDGAGIDRLFEVTKTPWVDATGRLAGLVSVARDVTAERAAQARLRHVQAELLRASRLSAMGAMASGLAHELNQPLAAAANFLNASARLLGPMTTAPDSAARAAVTDAVEQVLRAGAIVRRLRGFIGGGEAELELHDVDEVIGEACEVARADGTATDVPVVIDVGADVGRALVDRTQMQQVLLNLLRNAAESIAAGPQRPGEPQARITIRARKLAHDGLKMPPGALPEGVIEIAVSDTGPGLPSGPSERLFEPFVTTKADGMGIGLAICRTIVEGHGGKLTASPNPGGGALFRIVLPQFGGPASFPPGVPTLQHRGAADV